MTQFRQSDQHVGIQYNADHITIQQPSQTLTEGQRRQNRLRMLQRVQRIWIAGVLEPSMQGSDHLALEWRDASDAVVAPFLSVLREPRLGRSLAPVAQTSIVQVYDHADGELLILGEPGAGKTMLLLELTRALLERAFQDESHPIPVVFSLSSWAMTRQPLIAWLASELYSRYQIPRPLATFWISMDLVLPLLDGLDEVAMLHRVACVEAINSYRQTHGLISTVVSSRQSDYLLLPVHLLLRAAVVVQPLTAEQIASYLGNGGARLEMLGQALIEDGDLRALARNPLMLNVLASTYDGVSSQASTVTGSLAMKREHIFDTYVQRMLGRRGSRTTYGSEETIHWLSCLAQHMKRQSQTVFYLEQMQPDWLSSTDVYYWWAILLPGMLMGILVCLVINTLFGGGLSLVALVESTLLGGLSGGILSGGHVLARGKRSGNWYVSWLSSGIVVGSAMGLAEGLNSQLTCGLLYGLIFGLSALILPLILVKSHTDDAVSPECLSAWKIAWWSFLRRGWLHNGLLVGMVLGLSFGLSDGLIYGLILNPFGLSVRLRDALDSGSTNGWVIALNAVLHANLAGRLCVALSYDLLSYGLNFSFIGCLLSLLLSDTSIMVQLTDRLIWSWSNVARCLRSLRHLRVTLLIAVFVGLIDGLSDGPVVSLSVGLMAALIYWLLFGFFQGIPSALVGDQQRLFPNQGVHHSALNGLVLVLITASIVVPIFLGSGLVFVLLNRDIPPVIILLGALKNGLVIGLCSGLLAGLLKGGWACLRHYTLRFLLWRRDIIPWNYVRLLDDASEHLLLRKVGGGYIFLHQLFLDYFASLETEIDA